MSETLATQLEEGDGKPSIPDPQKAKLKELTEYCRAIDQWPDGWTKMKAVEKRKAFRRQFCPQATETFDSSDPTHLITERVETMGKDQAKPTIERLTNDVGMNYFELGGVFARISREGWYADFGHPNFKEWVEAETDMKRLKAEYLARIYVKFVELEIPWAKFKDIGWSKTVELLPVINQENADEWIEKARVLSRWLLREEVKRAKGIDGSEGDGDGESDENPKMEQLNFRLYKDQAEVVNAALEKMKEESGKEGRGICLEWLCASYLSDQFSTADLSQTSDITNMGGVAEAIEAILVRAKELVPTDYQALAPIVEKLDKVFPEATVDVEANNVE